MLEAPATVTRDALLDHLARAAGSVRVGHPARVAFDGPDLAGKTTTADELAAILRARGREVIRASADGFHRPRAERYRRGQYSPEGCYEDTFDYPALCRGLLGPLGPGGTRRYRTEAFDYRTDTASPGPAALAADDAVLLFDGVFLQRPELRDVWDLRIYVSINFGEILRRARERDAGIFGSAAEAERRYRSRYIPAQRLYLAEARPAEHADIIVLNDDPARPVLQIRIRG